MDCILFEFICKGAIQGVAESQITDEREIKEM